MAPQVLQLLEIEPPQELAAALNDDFLAQLGISSPPPVQIAELEAWGGYCHAQDTTDGGRGEVIIADWRTPLPRWQVVERIQAIYLHETSHRLLSAVREIESHGVEFFALQLLLLIRAGKRKDGYPWFFFFKAYDFQDSMEDRGIPGVPSTGATIDFAMELAFELAGQKITAEMAAQEICRRAKAWREEIAAAPVRREAAQKAAREKFEALQIALTVARDKIFWWRYGAVMLAGSGFVAGAIFY